MTAAKELVIDRALWGMQTLINTKDTLTRGPKGSMCCLGWLCKAYGHSSESMVNRSYPPSHDISRWADNPPEELCNPINFPRSDIGSDWPAYVASRINDNTYMSQTEKEDKLIKLFDSKGIKLSFIGTHWSTSVSQDLVK